MLFLLKATIFANDSPISRKSQRRQWWDGSNHGSNSLRRFDTETKERNSMKAMQFLSISVNGRKTPSEQLQNVTMEVVVEDDEGKEGMETEEVPLEHHLPRSFVSDVFKVLPALTCYNCLYTEIIASESDEDGMFA